MAKIIKLLICGNWDILHRFMFGNACQYIPKHVSLLFDISCARIFEIFMDLDLAMDLAKGCA